MPIEIHLRIEEKDGGIETSMHTPATDTNTRLETFVGLKMLEHLRNFDEKLGVEKEIEKN